VRLRPLKSIFPVCCLALPLASAHLRAQAADNEDRPHLSHQTTGVVDYKLPEDPEGVDLETNKGSQLWVVSGIPLPPTGRLYVLDNFAGKPELVRIKFENVMVNNHVVSNVLKTEAVPFFYKPKETIEIKGPAAEVRLHETSPSFFVRRSLWSNDESSDASNAASIQSGFCLVRLQSKSDRRIAATLAFRQFTGHASRTDAIVETVVKPVPGGDWFEIQPKEPLAPGEYGWMSIPNGQNMFGLRVYDFAIDTAAPENAGALTSSAQN
jgi:hypothetical protein